MIRQFSAFFLNCEEEVVPPGRAAMPSGGELEMCSSIRPLVNLLLQWDHQDTLCEWKLFSSHHSTSCSPSVHSEMSLQRRTVPGNPARASQPGHVCACHAGHPPFPSPSPSPAWGWHATREIKQAISKAERKQPSGH